LLWYAVQTGGTGSSAAPTPATGTAGTTNNYVSQTVNGLESTRATIQVIVYVPPGTADAGSDQNITSFTTALSANTPGSGTGSWTVVSGTGNFADVSNPNTNVSGLSTGDNTLRWTISSGPCSPSFDEMIIHIPIAPASQGISGSVNVIANAQGVTYSIPYDAGSTFSWSVPSDATIVSGQGTNSIVVNFGSSGGTISVIQTNAFGSANSSIVVGMTVTGIATIDLADIEVYPNPFFDELSLKSNIASGTNFTLKMIDMKGVTIFETDNCPSDKQIILPKELPAGIYIVLVIHDKGMKTIKLEKK